MRPCRVFKPFFRLDLVHATFLSRLKLIPQFTGLKRDPFPRCLRRRIHHEEQNIGILRTLCSTPAIHVLFFSWRIRRLLKLPSMLRDVQSGKS